MMNSLTNLLSNEKNSSELLKLFSSIISMSQDGIYVCDKKGKTELVNDALIEITKIPKEVFYKYNLDELIEKKILPKSCALQTLLTKRKHNMIIDYYDGKKAILTSTPVFDKSGEIFCVVSNVRDITELKNLQEQLEESNRKNMEYQKLLFGNERLNDDPFVARSKNMRNIITLASKFAENDSPILLLGESGVGKDVLAEYIHKKSGRTGEFVRINCGAIPAHLLESELFGHEKGAFTGANMAKVGLFELAHKGTIFLDEIGDMPYELQVKLLNVLQERAIRRIGSTKSFDVDMKVIAATNHNLSEMVEQKKFRKDLYYRLNVLALTIPPLRERKEDITSLTIYFLNKLNRKYKANKSLETDVLDHFLTYNWPGNVRELNNMIERMYHMSEDNIISMNVLPQSLREHSRSYLMDASYEIEDKYLPLKEAVNHFEKRYILQAIENSSTLKECAKKLDIGISTLMRKKSNLGIK